MYRAAGRRRTRFPHEPFYLPSRPLEPTRRVAIFRGAPVRRPAGTQVRARVGRRLPSLGGWGGVGGGGWVGWRAGGGGEGGTAVRGRALAPRHWRAARPAGQPRAARRAPAPCRDRPSDPRLPRLSRGFSAASARSLGRSLARPPLPLVERAREHVARSSTVDVAAAAVAVAAAAARPIWYVYVRLEMQILPTAIFSFFARRLPRTNYVNFRVTNVLFFATN